MPFFAAAAAAVLIVGAGAYSCSKHDNNDRLSDGQASGTREATAAGTTGAATADPARRCASTRTYDLLKRELFRRAAQIRGNADPALFDRIALAAALRVERPLVTSSDEGLGSIACSASAAIDLPPGLAVAGGRTTLAADLGYTLQPAADGSGDVLAFTNADAIVVPLATIGRTSAGIPPATVPQAIPPADYIPSPVSPNPPPPPAPVVVHRPTPTPAPVQAPVADPVASPSFSCARARTRGEIALCGDPGLAATDRQMATQYRSAYAAASPAAQVALRTTAHRFYGFRDNCPDARCIASGYRQRMREIDDIMARDER
ncbi:MAG: hypothetical protein ABIR77_08060 [Sphingomicrobium sp.]